MTWAKLETLLARYRHAATIAIAGAVALISTLSIQHGTVNMGLGASTKLFTFLFAASVVVVAVVFTVLLVIAETKVEAAKRGPQPEFPVAIAREVPHAAQSVPAITRAPVATPSNEQERGNADDPSFLR